MCRFGLLLFLVLSPVAFGHGGVVEEDDLCVIKIGYLRAHFKIYVPAERQHQEYCEDIPVRGDSVFVMEYQHDGLSKAEIDFRIVRNVTGKGNFARLSDIEAIADLDAITIRYEPAAVVPDVYTLLQPFEEDGEYIGIISARQPDTQVVYTAVFPFEVGYTGLGFWPWIIAAVVALQLGYWFMGRRAHRSTNTLVLLAAAALLAPYSIAKADESWVSDSGYFTVTFRSELQPLAINRIHSWILHVEDSDGNPITDAEIEIKGGMPEHNHGLPTAPQVNETSQDGDYEVGGMRFHMRGYWEIRIQIDVGDQRDSVMIPLDL